MTELNKELEQWECLVRSQKKRERQERIAREKEEKHWCFIAGALVAKYLKDELDIPVFKGKDAAAKNAVSFAPLENILSYLATNKDFTARIKGGDSVSPPDSL